MRDRPPGTESRPRPAPVVERPGEAGRARAPDKSVRADVLRGSQSQLLGLKLAVSARANKFAGKPDGGVRRAEFSRPRRAIGVGNHPCQAMTQSARSPCLAGNRPDLLHVRP